MPSLYISSSYSPVKYSYHTEATFKVGVDSKGMTPLEISYACPEIKGNHDRNHWKSGLTSEITICHEILFKIHVKS